ncbi:iron uptake transporter permease EfeU [Nocardioides terrisoli]|uniref:iron uptake transporter permease EfeU n=1 Tax=Nocardioides terrisoli TaxID=3388267 RepID=UPI00287BC0E4|nr:iron uptake transporter permease EfeU [Nocardioides marmorisolisilvae]
MLPTFVIGLREGLEAALIVGIIAAFLRRQRRGDLLRQMAGGVTLAVLVCIGVGVALEAFSRDLPQQQQEGLETVIGLLAVAMVTYMVAWMKEHSRGLKHQLEGAAAEAMAGGGSRAGRAMVFMAFLAVLREGFETVVFLLAAFNESGAGAAALVGAVLGIAVAIALGYGIYRGGVRINLSKFFRATGLVLVLVAAGLVVSALHTAHEAGWLDVGQQQVLDLSWLVQPGSVLSSLLTGMLGIQPHPALIEVVGWLVYLVPVGVFVTWPQHRPVPLRGLARGFTAGAVLALASGTVVAVLAPSAPTSRPTTTDKTISARVLAVEADSATVRTQDLFPLTGRDRGPRALHLTHTGATTMSGVAAQTYQVRLFGRGSGPATLTTRAAAALNGGRLPVGVLPGSHHSIAARYRTTRVLDVSIEPRTRRVLDVHWSATEHVEVPGPAGDTLTLGRPLRKAAASLSTSARDAATAAAKDDLATLDRHRHMTSLGWLLGSLGVAGSIGAALVQRRRRAGATVPAMEPTPEPSRG